MGGSGQTRGHGPPGMDGKGSGQVGCRSSSYKRPSRLANCENSVEPTCSGLNLLHLLPVLAIPVVILVLCVLTLLDISTVFEPRLLLPVLNTVFLAALPLVAVFGSMRGYLASGYVPLIILGSGWLWLGLGSLLSGMMIPVGARPNAVVTLHNSSALLTGVCQVAGAALAFVGIDRQQDPRLRRQHVVLACLGITVLVILFATAVMKRLFPPLFVQGHGPTAWHQAVLGTAMGLFAISGLAFAGLHLFSKARCVFWYSLALFLIATGLLCFFVQNSVGDPVSWLGRGSHYLAGVYLLIAVVVASREIRLKGDELYQGIEDLFRHRLELLVEERTAQLRRANVQLSHEIAERIRAEEALKVAHAELELKVQERTAQLSEANEALRKEVAQRERSAKALRERTEALERANKELEHFAYIASHDLREPLRKISTFTELLAKRFKGQLDEKGDKYICT